LYSGEVKEGKKINKTLDKIQAHLNKMNKDDPNIKTWAEIGRTLRGN